MAGFIIQDIAASSEARATGGRLLGCLLDNPVQPADLMPEWQAIHRTWRGKQRAELKAHPQVTAYCNYYRSIGVNPKDNPPAMSNLLQRFFLGNTLDRVPQRHPFVDAGNVAALEYMIPVAVFDADFIAGRMLLDTAREGDMFHGHGYAQPEPVSPGTIVLRDEEKVLSIFCYRDGVAQAVRDTTRRVYILAAAVPGVPANEVIDTIRRAAVLMGTIV